MVAYTNGSRFQVSSAIASSQNSRRAYVRCHLCLAAADRHFSPRKKRASSFQVSGFKFQVFVQASEADDGVRVGTQIAGLGHDNGLHQGSEHRGHRGRNASCKFKVSGAGAATTSFFTLQSMAVCITPVTVSRNVMVHSAGATSQSKARGSDRT